jgi:hypothetical protein
MEYSHSLISILDTSSYTPLVSLSAMAVKGGVNPGGGSTFTCVHNENGAISSSC